MDTDQLNAIGREIHEWNQSVGWWDGMTPENQIYYLMTKINLIHSETSELTEALRKDLTDDYLTHRTGEECECADIIIRVLDYCAARGLDISGAVREKHAYNMRRSDHKRENRAESGGKKV